MVLLNLYYGIVDDYRRLRQGSTACRLEFLVQSAHSNTCQFIPLAVHLFNSCLAPWKNPPENSLITMVAICTWSIVQIKTTQDNKKAIVLGSACAKRQSQVQMEPILCFVQNEISWLSSSLYHTVNHSYQRHRQQTTLWSNMRALSSSVQT